MKAIRIHQHGGPEVLRLEDVADPVPGPGEALVQLEASGINFIEIYERTGLYRPALPFTPGTEGAGTVVAIGAGVVELRPGDRVASEGLRGTYAERAVAPVARLVKLPDAVDARQGAAVMIQGLTAHYLATSTLPARAWRLVPGARRGRWNRVAVDPDRGAARRARDRDGEQ